ncbi:MAG TPA: hypothetical protein VM263_05355, partial [Acidimicrobiales bacterium]|nr:hypothetical protein [Acidimicrobiales bacterium]
MDIRRVVRGLGRTLIAAGVLILLFVAYQLWGTGLAEARHQRQLTRQFERSLLEAPATTTTATTAPAATPSPSDPPITPATLPAGPPPTPEGDAVALIRIPSIGVDKAVVEGVSLAALKRGPGHYPGTALSTPMLGMRMSATPSPSDPPITPAAISVRPRPRTTRRMST